MLWHLVSMACSSFKQHLYLRQNEVAYTCTAGMSSCCICGQVLIVAEFVAHGLDGCLAGSGLLQ